MNLDPEPDDVSGDLTGAFLRQADFANFSSQRFSIVRVEKKSFEAKNGRPAESKWVVTFDGDRCLSLNKTNLNLLARWFGPHTRDWIGKEIAVYRDESISFGGRLTGGLRVRRPSGHDETPF